MTHQTCDVVILGGGPAGSATALMLHQHNPQLSVVLVERTRYEQIRIGETLPPGVRPLLNQLGIWPTFDARGYLRAHGTQSVWGSERRYENEFLFTLNGYGWHLDRRDFDAMLAQTAAQRGMQLYLGTRLQNHAQLEDGWGLQLVSEQGATIELQAQFIVDATGRRSSFARTQGAKRETYDRLMGAFLFSADHNDLSDQNINADTTTLLEAWEGGWWYSALLPTGEMVIACMSDADLIQQHGFKNINRWLHHLDQTRYTKARLKPLPSQATPQLYNAQTSMLNPLVGKGWLAVGDAATTFDPLSSQGIFKALRSGIFAAYAISDSLAGDVAGLKKYSWMVEQEFAGYLKTWREYYAQEQRWSESIFWQRRHVRVEI